MSRFIGCPTPDRRAIATHPRAISPHRLSTSPARSASTSSAAIRPTKAMTIWPTSKWSSTRSGRDCIGGEARRLLQGDPREPVEVIDFDDRVHTPGEFRNLFGNHGFPSNWHSIFMALERSPRGSTAGLRRKAQH